MAAPATRQRLVLALEWFLGLAVVAGLIHAYVYLQTDGVLPPPFYFAYNDTFMDGFNTAYWAAEGGAYDIWLSIYPPISFAFLKLFSMSRCYIGSNVYWRTCDWYFPAVLIAFSVLNIGLVYAMYRKDRRATAIPRTIAVALGMPMLFALERGNLIIPTFTFFVLATGNLLPQARLRWLSAAIAVNFKPYLIAAVFAVLLRRRWRWFEGAVLATVLVYAVTWTIIGDGSPMQVYRNTVTFAESGRTSDWTVAYYPSSYIPLHDFLANSPTPLLRMLGSFPLDFASWFLPAITRFTQAFAVLAAAVIWLRPGLFPATRAVALAIMIALTAQETGGYAVCFATFLVFFEEGQGWCRIGALILCYALSICVDFIVVQLDVLVSVESFLGGRPVTASYGLTLGTLIRPLGLLLVMNLLSLATVHRFVAVLRAEGRLVIPWRASRAYAAQS